MRKGSVNQDPATGEVASPTATAGQGEQDHQPVAETTPPSSSRSRWLSSRPWRLAAHAVLWTGWALLAYLLLCFFPGPPEPILSGVDPSWMWGLNLAHQMGLAHGKEILFTFGPLGYLTVPAFPEASAAAAKAYALSLFVLWAYSLLRLAWVWRDRWAALASSLLMAVIGVLYGHFMSDRLEIVIIALAILLAAQMPRPALYDLGALAVLAAVALLTKFNTGVQSTALFCCFLGSVAWLQHPLSRRDVNRLAIVAALMPLSLLVLWAWAGQGASGFLPYLRGSWEVASGYSDAMSLTGPAWQAALAFASLLALFGLFPIIADRRRDLLPVLAPALVIAFFAFKHAMVRQDEHAAPFQWKVTFLAILLATAMAGLRDRVALVGLAILSAFVGVGVVHGKLPDLFRAELGRFRPTHVVFSVRESRDWERHARALAAARPATLRSRLLEPEVESRLRGHTADVYPFAVDRIAANELRWRPRPAIQSYTAYTPRLDRVNATELSGPSAPEKIVLEWGTIDDRHMLFDDPLSLRAILDGYDVEMATPDVLVLSRRQGPRYGSPAFAGEQVIAWGQEVKLPPVAPGEVLLLEADVQQNLAGKLITLLWRGTAVYVEATLWAGTPVRGRAVRANLISGVPISHWPSNLAELTPLLDGVRSDRADRVDRFRLTTRLPWEFSPRIRIRFQRLRPLDAAPSGF